MLNMYSFDLRHEGNSRYVTILETEILARSPTQPDFYDCLTYLVDQLMLPFEIFEASCVSRWGG